MNLIILIISLLIILSGLLILFLINDENKYIFGGILILLGLILLIFTIIKIFRRKKNPEKFCGSSRILPEGYKSFGTNYDCLKKGIGTGIAVTEEQIKNGDTSIRNKRLRRKRIKKYCGNQTDLPENYDRLGNRYDCLKKGYGVGMMMTKNKYFS